MGLPLFLKDVDGNLSGKIVVQLMAYPWLNFCPRLSRNVSLFGTVTGS